MTSRAAQRQAVLLGHLHAPAVSPGVSACLAGPVDTGAGPPAAFVSPQAAPPPPPRRPPAHSAPPCTSLPQPAGGPAPMEAQPTSVGDSAAYERRNLSCDDVVIVSACRTALCKAKRGGFKDTPVDDLIAAVLKDTIRRTGVEPEVGGCSGWGWGGSQAVRRAG